RERHRTVTTFQPTSPPARSILQASSRRRSERVFMKTATAAALAVVALAFGASFAAAGSTGGSLKGAGSTFVFPLVSQWQANYKNAQITYGSEIGRAHV